MAKTPDGESGAAASLIGAAREAGRRGPPPVHLWNPPFCGDIDIRIARDGTWFYLGTPIGRPELVALFSSILWREGDDHFLVTPVEKVRIRVDDAPFVAVDFTREGETLVFLSNVGERIAAGPDHPIRVERDATTGEPAPYVLIRRDLWALIDRKSFYRLVDEGGVEGEDFGVRSGGRFFAIAPAEGL
ncbi:MAG: DUF1285 domain-containing protein [Rubellimicrobium sp.]|nr:DUF1285 domain-containing protein [Rubellimicrobium sp.]